MELLLESGIDPNDLLIHAAHRPKIVQVLINAGADVNFVDTKGKGGHPSTPLCKAARSNVVESIDLLIEAGADVNRKDAWGTPALLYAVSSISLQSVTRLIEAGADVNIKDVNGNTSFHFSTCFGVYQKIYTNIIRCTKVLLATNIKINVANNIHVICSIFNGWRQTEMRHLEPKGGMCGLMHCRQSENSNETDQGLTNEGEGKYYNKAVKKEICCFLLLVRNRK